MAERNWLRGCIYTVFAVFTETLLDVRLRHRNLVADARQVNIETRTRPRGQFTNENLFWVGADVPLLCSGGVYPYFLRVDTDDLK